MIELKNVVKVYESKNTENTRAIDDVSLKLANKGLTFIVGTSGSGKSTLLNVLGGLDSINSGSIIVDGRELNKFNKKELDNYRNTYVGFVFQDYNVIEDYNLEDNISLSLDLQGIKNDTLVEETIEKVGLSGLNKREMNELSGGQKQRVAIARAIVKNPRLLLADEPTGNLDSKTSEQIIKLLKDISIDQLVVVVSHDMELAKLYADRIIEISDGKITNDTNIFNEESINNLELKDSKLPLKRSIKLANKYMQHKMGRMALTIFLTSIATFFFIFALNVLIFNGKSLYKKVISDNKIDRIQISRGEYKRDGMFYSHTNLELTDKHYEELNQLNEQELYRTYYINNNGNYLNFEYDSKEENYRNEYYYEFSPEFIEITKDSYIGNVKGRMPNSSNEVVVDQYIADHICFYGVYLSDGNLYKPTNLDALIEEQKELKLGNTSVKIVGIVMDSKNYNELYKDVKKGGPFPNQEFQSHYYGIRDFDKYIYSIGLIDKIDIPFDKENQLKDIIIKNVWPDNNIVVNSETKYYDEFGNIQVTNSLNDNELIISMRYFMLLYDSPNMSLEDRINFYIKEHKNLTYDEAKIEVILEFTRNYNVIGKEIPLEDGKWLKAKNNAKVKVVGISMDNNNYVSENILNNFENTGKNLVGITLISEDKKSLNKIIDTYPVISYDFKKPYKGYLINYKYSEETSSIVSAMKFIKKYMWVITFIFGLFDILLIYNFVIITIKFAKKNIGILRALGTKSSDIIKIFAVESLVVSFSSWILSIILWVLASHLLNNSLFGSKYFILNGIVLEPIVVLINIVFIITIMLLVMILSISRVSKINPIDVINNKA